MKPPFIPSYQKIFLFNKLCDINNFYLANISGFLFRIFYFEYLKYFFSRVLPWEFNSKRLKSIKLWWLPLSIHPSNPGSSKFIPGTILGRREGVNDNICQRGNAFVIIHHPQEKEIRLILRVLRPLYSVTHFTFLCFIFCTFSLQSMFLYCSKILLQCFLFIQFFFCRK